MYKAFYWSIRHVPFTNGVAAMNNSHTCVHPTTNLYSKKKGTATRLSGGSCQLEPELSKTMGSVVEHSRRHTLNNNLTRAFIQKGKLYMYEYAQQKDRAT